MKQIVLLIFLTLFSCSQSNDEENNKNLDLEINVIEETNHLYRNNVEILKAELPKTFQSNENILLKIKKFKTDLRENKLIEKTEMDDFLSLFLKFENHAYFPNGYLHLLKHSKTPQSQYKYVMLIENYLYQSMLYKLQESFVRFNFIQPFALTNNEKYKLNDEVLVKVGFAGINTFKPYEIIIDHKHHLIDSVKKVGQDIRLKANKRGNNKIKGILKYEDTEVPFFVNFEVE